MWEVNEPVDFAGLDIPPGTSAALNSHVAFSDWLMPVVVLDQDGLIRVNGTAVCIGNGIFVTAKHVVDYLLDDRCDEDAGVWIAWTTGPLPIGPKNAFRGQMMAVIRYRPHPRVDLAILTVALPAGAIGRHRTVPWSLRMPKLGERVSLLGYPDGRADADLGGEIPGGVVLDYPLVLGVGTVTGHRDTWGVNPSNPRSWPGIETDAPMPSAMSGGAVLDRQNRLIGFSSSAQSPMPPEHLDWNGFVNLAGFLVDLYVDMPGPDGTLKVMHMEDLVKTGVVPCLVDPSTFYIDEDGRASYRLPSSELF